jgi:hypothetical protein
VTGILGQTHRIRQVKKLASLVGLDSKHNSEVNIYLASTSTWRQHLLGVNIFLASTSTWRQHLLGVSIYLASASILLSGLYFKLSSQFNIFIPYCTFIAYWTKLSLYEEKRNIQTIMALYGQSLPAVLS